MFRKSCLWLGVAAGWLLTSLTPASAQLNNQLNNKGGEFIPGTVVSVEKDKTGRNHVLKFTNTADGEEYTVNLTPRSPLMITAEGDEGFFKPGVLVGSRVVKAQDSFFGKDYTVYVVPLQRPGVKPDPQARDVYDVVGKLEKVEADGVWITGATPQPVKLSFDEAGTTIKVVLNDPSLIKEGDEINVEGKMLRGKKTINATSIQVTSKEKLSGEQYFADLEERSKPKSKSKASAKAKEGEPDAADPFGVLKKKTEKKEGDTEKKEGDKPDAKEGAAKAKDE